jgi:hypothetical protein
MNQPLSPASDDAPPRRVRRPLFAPGDPYTRTGAVFGVRKTFVIDGKAELPASLNEQVWRQARQPLIEELRSHAS